MAQWHHQKKISLNCFFSSVNFFFGYAISMNHGVPPLTVWRLEFETNCCCPNSIRYVICDEITVGI